MPNDYDITTPTREISVTKEPVKVFKREDSSW